MQTWSENVAGRGSTEVAICLYNFVYTCNESSKRTILLWSDSCSGQNKNFHEKFPEVRLDDQDVGWIDKVLKKRSTIYTPYQYRQIIKTAYITKKAACKVN